MLWRRLCTQTRLTISRLTRTCAFPRAGMVRCDDMLSASIVTHGYGQSYWRKPYWSVSLGAVSFPSSRPTRWSTSFRTRCRTLIVQWSCGLHTLMKRVGLSVRCSANLVTNNNSLRRYAASLWTAATERRGGTHSSEILGCRFVVLSRSGEQDGMCILLVGFIDDV